MLTQARLKRLLHYDPQTGVFSRSTGAPTGTVRDDGRVVITVDGKKYLASRLAWLYIYGDWPKKEAEHRDGNPRNDALSNLRDATHAQNMQNVGIQKNNTLGYKGIGLEKSGRWYARIYCDGRAIRLGTFETTIEASEAYTAASKKYHGEFARH